MKYTKDYYTTNNYADYLLRQSRYSNIARETMFLLEKHGVELDSVLDFGCAVGMLMTGLRRRGVKNLYGVDISEWARNQASMKFPGKIFDSLPCGEFSVVYFLDVLEHMTIKEVCNTLESIVANALVIRLPLSAKDGERYILDVSEADPTHIIRWTRETWYTLFNAYGYEVYPIVGEEIYDSEAVLAVIAIKV